MITLLAKQLMAVLKIEPQSREELCVRLHCNDRSLRLAVAELRLQGYNVASSSHCKGYWLGTKEEMKHVAYEYFARAAKVTDLGEAVLRGAAFHHLAEMYDEKDADSEQMEVEL